MNIVQLLEQYRIDYRATGHEHCRPGWVQIDCPDCSRNKQRFRLGINLYRLNANCWACGPKKLTQVIFDYTGLGFGQIRGALADLVKHLGAIDTVKRTAEKVSMPFSTWPLHAVHKKYLRGRGFDPVHISKEWGVQGIRLSGRWSWRLFIPVFYRDELVSWTTRSTNDDHPLRYRSASAKEEKVNHKDVLYGEDKVDHTIIVCEGPTDVWRIGAGAVCTFGTGFRNAQISSLTRYPIRVVCYDAEKEGQRRARVLCDLLAPFDGETYNVVLDAKDPGSASEKEIKKLRKRFNLSY